MKAITYSKRHRATLIIVALMLALGMMFSLPASAFAEEDSWWDSGIPDSGPYGNLEILQSVFQTTVGNPVDLNFAVAGYDEEEYGYDSGISHDNNIGWIPYPRVTHLDYKVISGSAYGTVDKHSGIFTPTANGTATIGVYLTVDEGYTSNPSEACDAIDDWATFTVHVGPISPTSWQTGIPDFDPQGNIWMGNDEYEFTTDVNSPIPLDVLGDPTWNTQLYPNAHIDYRVIAEYSTPGAGSVNKHSGLVQATGEGTLTIFVYLTQGPIIQIMENPCVWPPIDYMVVTVNIVGEAEGYGPQGLNQTIMMTNPTVSSFFGNTTIGWINELNGGFAIPTENGIANFTITQAFGIGGNFQQFVTWNAENVYVVDEFGDLVDGTMLGDGLALTLSATTGNPVLVYHLNTNLVEMTSGEIYYLVFEPTYRAGNMQASSLEIPVVFEFIF